MIDLLLREQPHADPLINLLCLIPLGALLGIAISLSHSFSGNIWLRQRNYMMLSMILPVVALVITKSISSNIFLSLGMIGALSIIRYRAPIKSPYELGLLFSFITIGISLGVDIRYAFLYSVFCVKILRRNGFANLRYLIRHQIIVCSPMFVLPLAPRGYRCCFQICARS